MMNLQTPEPRQRDGTRPGSPLRAQVSVSPVIGGELTPPQVGGGDDAAAFVLTVPDGAGHLQHTQHPPVPATAAQASGGQGTLQDVWTDGVPDGSSRPLDPHPLLVDGGVVLFTERQSHRLLLTACFS